MLSGSSSKLNRTTHAPLVGLSLLAAIAISLLLISANGDLTAGLCLLVMTTSIAAAALTLLCLTEFGRPIAFVSLIYMIFFYLIPGMIHVVRGEFPFFAMSYPESTIVGGALMVLLFILAAMAGYCFYASRHKRLDALPIGRSGPRLAEISPLSVLLLLPLFALAYKGAESFQILRGDASLLQIEATPIDLILTAVARTGTFVCFAVPLATLGRNPSSAKLLFLIVAAPLFVLANNPLSTPRYVIAAYLLATVLCIFSFSRRVRFGLLAGFVVSQVTLFPILSELSRGDIRNYLSGGPITYLARHGDFDGFQSTLNVYEMVQGAGIFQGRQLISAVLFFVPREFMPWKSIGTGGDAATFVGYKFINVSAPLPSELYVDFGYIGLLLLSFVIGMIAARWDKMYIEAILARDLLSRLRIALICGFAFIVLRGSLIGVIGPVICSLLIVRLARFLFGWFESIPRRSSRRLKRGPAPKVSRRASV
ncbi:hypothetical protein RA307_17770 [Xanthobacteraceae bacterium Astr-EGSB]|uniref:hypothetical protein n=1 Tax=Astrobacterium formosum TaxID=3069710 RepID=UPI0027B4EE3A|nr:hypothetical protein [Xanthobacteraceae bacterium Astr-EGSB]